ncbi:hypothetical protein POK33_38135 [Burkholderia cenocepacia]|uniref:hypothetical protein n=1 Tax=Burkholderia cenocepacia TaxID=95486 RepID=UPI0023B9F73F|nr:hypothetical protein [Burkholderia cenocepacia]MDF0506575.1 hypothetical protein [Burkholderia cenocepacia]
MTEHRFGLDEVVLCHNKETGSRWAAGRTGRVIELVVPDDVDTNCNGYVVAFDDGSEVVVFEHGVCKPTERAWIH